MGRNRVPWPIGIRLILLACLAVPPIGSDVVHAAGGRIEVTVLDKSGKITPVRAWVDAAGRRLFNPVAPDTATPYARDRSFSCDGTFTMAVPAGKAVVHIEKGKEFLPVDAEVDVSPDETIVKKIQIKRWVDMPGRGWYAADLHVHFGADDPRILRQLSLADDVHLIPAFTYWLRGRGERWKAAWPDEGFTQPTFVDDQHIITRNNIEIERINRNAVPGGTIGATFLFNLNQPVTAERYGEHFPTDADLCRAARRQSPAAVYDSDKPSWAETVVGAALGALDTVQLCHNHFHRSSTIPGGWGMIGPLAPGESNAATDDGLFHRTNTLYYRFLNCGFRLGVSGGSAIGVMAMPAGHHRVYARVDGQFTAEKMWASIRAGRSFATTGPMLSLDVNREGIGSTISLESAHDPPLKLQSTVRSIETVDSLEIVYNGDIIASRDLSKTIPNPRVDAVLDSELTPKRSGWVVSRVLYRAPDGLLRQAHTSPIYISVDNRPTASAADARYMCVWIDRLTNIAETQPDRFPDEEARGGVLATYAEARARYEEIIAEAQQHWSDK